jgi:hypothetical protein
MPMAFLFVRLPGDKEREGAEPQRVKKSLRLSAFA